MLERTADEALDDVEDDAFIQTKSMSQRPTGEYLPGFDLKTALKQRWKERKKWNQL